MSLAPSEIFKVLGVETRIQIIELLKNHGPIGANEIAKTVGISPAAVSQHLRILKQVGIVKSQRKGYWIPYSINKEMLEKYGDELNKICNCGCKDNGGFVERAIGDAGLEDLLGYKRELLKELRLIDNRIREFEQNN